VLKALLFVQKLNVEDASSIRTTATTDDEVRNIVIDLLLGKLISLPLLPFSLLVEDRRSSSSTATPRIIATASSSHECFISD
jgi:hypothetical protein